MSEAIIPPHGQYEHLLTYQKSVAIFDGTVLFCHRFLTVGDRTIDQMTQATRSCKQNLVEGSETSGTSRSGEIRLIGVARASLKELLEDYEDYLRTHQLPQWAAEDLRLDEIRSISRRKNFLADYRTVFENADVERFCNQMITLIHQTCYLIDRQLNSLQKRFTAEGGFRERMGKIRRTERSRKERMEENLQLLRKIYTAVKASLSPEAAAPILNDIALLGRKFKGDVNHQGS